MMTYLRLDEHNEWEGERWSFYIPVEGNETALQELRQAIVEMEAEGEHSFTLSTRRGKESAVDRRCARPSATGYLSRHNKLEGRLNLRRLLHPTSEEEQEVRDHGATSATQYMADVLYKGGIRDLMEALDTLEG